MQSILKGAPVVTFSHMKEKFPLSRNNLHFYALYSVHTVTYMYMHPVQGYSTVHIELRCTLGWSWVGYKNCWGVPKENICQWCVKAIGGRDCSSQGI